MLVATLGAVRRLALPFVLLALAAGCGDEPPPVDPTPDAAPPAAGQGNPPRGDLAVNEVASEPPSGPDWIELKNRGAEPLDLGGVFVTDAADRLDHYYAFPAGTTLAPGAYLLVWADDGDPGEGHHAPFQLGRADGVQLIAADGLPLDGFLYLAGDDGRALARVPDGEGLFFHADGTPAAPNPGALP